MKNLVTTVVGLCLLVWVQAQGQQIGYCNTYQTTPTFDQTFIRKMQVNRNGYSFLFTSLPTNGCKKLSFFPNGTFFYDFTDVVNGRTNTTGSYQMKPFSFTDPASITLSSLPNSELGSVLGTISFNVLIAEQDLLVLLSCINIGLIRTQHIHILIPESTSASVIASDVNTTVHDRKVPLVDHLEEVPQKCDAWAGSDEALRLLTQLYTSLGYFHPSSPGVGYGGVLSPGLHPVVNNPNVASALTSTLAQQSQSGYPRYGLQSLPGIQSPVYAQPTNLTNFQNVAPQLFGQQVVPKAPSSARFPLQQQFPNPINGFSGVAANVGSFGLPSQFAVHPAPVSQGIVSQAQQFQHNQPTQPVQVGSLQPGTHNTFQ